MNAFALAAGAALLLQVVLWRIQLRTRNAATIDAGWAVIVALGALVAALVSEGDIARRTIVASLVLVWAVRLAGYLIGDRALPGAAEDGRYRMLREQWGPAAPRNFLGLYLAQVLIGAVFVVPVYAAMRGGAPDAWMFAGIATWLVASLGEWTADRQLECFRAAPTNRGRVCREGLWRYSRHPNYFFEWLHWWAYVLIGHAAPATFVGPVVMLIFLYRITGIPYTERQALRSRGEAYRDYQRSTSAFFPWPPRARGTQTEAHP
ncbi:MAG: DUF1295 domain-containing protein [Gemmatimonadetes bacterium]|nr:DUF1295 domain-containing protein [Gemmatimonadota bacterium]